MKNANNPQTRQANANCPICKKPVLESVEAFPFCSARCKQIDLGRWADESYKITRPIEQRDLEEGVD